MFSGLPSRWLLRSARLRIPKVPVSQIKYYTNKVPDNNEKYKSIDDFNKLKKEYNFGELNTTSSTIHEKVAKKHQEEDVENDENNINSIIENDERLKNLKPGSPDYKYQLHLIHQEFQKQQQKQKVKDERNERLKAVGIGIVSLISIISIHQIVMNYEYLSKKINHKLKFNDEINESKVKDMSDPLKNTKSIQYLVKRLTEEFNKHPEIIENLINSNEMSGLYLSGEFNGNKLPVRFPFFNDMLINDVKLLKDYLVVIDSNGKVYHYYSKLSQPQQINIPGKVTKVDISGDLIYYLNKNGEVLYSPRLDKQVDEFTGISKRNWIGQSTEQRYNKLNFDDLKKSGESIQDISCGESHLLLLSNQGRLFINKTNDQGKNYGQFGLPKFSPFSSEIKQPINQIFELTNLNYEVMSNKSGDKYLNSRIFKNIASGKNHNIVSDSNGDIWTWGSNLFGECGGEISYKTDIKPIPSKILSVKDFTMVTKHLFTKNDHHWRINEVHANDETSFINLSYINDEEESKSQSILMSFGNGLKGQLGNSRYLHVCPKPQVIKPLINLTEFNEISQTSNNIGFKKISIGNNHSFITLDNLGDNKDVLTFGDNEFGQFGNGKLVKSCKPIQLPKLLEPNDINNDDMNDKKNLAKKLNDVINGRLQLFDNVKINGKSIEQVVVAGENSSAIFYKPK